MKSIIKNPASAAITSFILALPIALVYTITVLEREPFFGLLASVLTVDGFQPNALGFTVLIGGMLLLPVAFALNLLPIVRTMRLGGNIATHPITLLLASAILVFIALTWGGLFIDQIPCFIGVPNCD
jgi:hypothetical protein